MKIRKHNVIFILILEIVFIIVVAVNHSVAGIEYFSDVVISFITANVAFFIIMICSKLIDKILKSKSYIFYIIFLIELGLATIILGKDGFYDVWEFYPALYPFAGALACANKILDIKKDAKEKNENL